MKIHPTAIVEAGAELDSSVTVGAYAVIQAGVRIGPDSQIAPHAMLSGLTTIGARTVIGPFTSIGAPPQDLKYNNEPTRLVIGDDNHIREYVSIHRGTPSGHGVTTVGNHNLLMAYVHVAHDCVLGNHVIMANGTTLGGHVAVGDHANIGGMVAVHQFTRIGGYTYVGGMSGISKDVPPFIIVSGTRSSMRVTGINKIGLRRCGYDNETIRQLQKAFVIIFHTPELLLQEALAAALAASPDCEPVTTLVRFFRETTRSVVRLASDE